MIRSFSQKAQPAFLVKRLSQRLESKKKLKKKTFFTKLLNDSVSLDLFKQNLTSYFGIGKEI